MNMPISVVTSGGLPVQLSANGQGLPLQLATLAALPVTIVTTGGVPCLDPLGNVFTSLTEPVLAFVSATDPDSDTTQDLDVTLTLPVAGDKVYSCAKIDGFSLSNDPTEFDVRDIHTITQPEIDTATFPISLTLTPDGAWSVRVFHERSGSFSNASNIVTKTIATSSGAFFATRYFPNRYFSVRYFG